MHTHDVILDTSRVVRGVPMRMAVRRYWTDDPPREGVTLLFIHGTGTHKEHWEPIIQSLFDHQRKSASARLIREIWAVDNLTHGDSGVLNAALLKGPGRESMSSVADAANAIKEFIRSHLAGHRIVAIGHSGGAAILMYSTSLFAVQDIPYERIIIAEPAMVDRETFHVYVKEGKERLERMIRAISARRNGWDSHEAAFEWLMKRNPWKAWDPRTVRIYAEKGLYRPDPESSQVKLKCDPDIEAGFYREEEPNFVGCDQITNLCAHLPIHVIFGKDSELAPKSVNDGLVDPQKGRRVASVTRITSAGHMIVQEQPDPLADEIWRLLLLPPAPPSHPQPLMPQSRL